MKRFAVKSFGCQMNAYDAERMAETLRASGMAPADDEAPADVVVLNTCHIREKAAEKVYSEIGRIAAAARDDGRPKPLIAVAGCVAQAEGAEISRRARAVDVVVGPQAYHRLPELLDASRSGPVVDTDMAGLAKFGALPERRRASQPSAFLTIQEGCDKFCAFCVVPYTRGAEACRPMAAVLDEARRLIDGGAKELTLLGQNVNAWREPAGGVADFADLLGAVAALPGLRRLRYTTSHPRDVTPRQIEAHAAIPQLMPYLHLPVQSGSDRVLKAMNRRHRADVYLDLIARVRAARPGIALSGDFIVGFPGETDAEFENTLSLVKSVAYAQAFSFKYSPRLGTPAAEIEAQVPEPVKDERLARLQAQLADDQRAFNRATVGVRTDVLLERPGKKPGQHLGKSPWLQSVHVVGNNLALGDIVTVDIVAATQSSLEGRLVEQVSEAVAAW